MTSGDRRVSRRLATTLLVGAIAGSAVTVSTQTPDRSKPPTSGAPPVFKVPPVERRTLPNGLRVWLVEMHDVPVVDMTMIVRSGASADPAERFGLANFTAAMLDEGAGTRSALELSDAVDFLGASLTTASTFDASTVRLHALTSKLDDALPLSDVVLRPTFPVSELERVRKERLTTLLQARDNPATLASAALARLLYGVPHRYGTSLAGTETTNRAVTVADLRGFYDAHYQPQNACLLIVGDVSASQVLPKIEQAFGSWKRGTAAATPAPAMPAKPATERHVYLLNKPGAAQSEIRIGGIGVPRTTPDYFTLEVLNTILGGSFTSRLNQNLREQHGYTYGASSRFDMRRGAGPFLAGAGVQTDKTVESLHEFFKELDGIHTPVAAAELSRARNLDALSFPGEFETTRDMAGKLAELAVFDLPESSFGDDVPKIQAVTAADLQRAAGQYIQPDALTVVVVGDLAKIETLVRNASLGPVTVLTADDVLK